MHNLSAFEKFALTQNIDDPNEAFRIQNAIHQSEIRWEIEKKKLVKEITEQVIQRITASVDFKEVLEAIDEINYKIKNLGTY